MLKHLRELEFGVDSFMPVSNGADGLPIPGDQVIRNTIEEGVLAEQAGIDSFNIGEHFRDDSMDSANHVVLAAIAARTQKIKLGTAVTVLSTQDPVRTYQNFATLDAISNGRVQLIVGRGSAIESFPLFGYDLREYEEIFEEKLDLWVRILAAAATGEPLTWSGKYRPPLNSVTLTPPLRAGSLTTWVGSGGSPASTIRAARYGLPLVQAIIGGDPARFRPLIDLYRRALVEYSRPADLPIGLHTLGYVAPTDEEAVETQWPHWLAMHERASIERGWPPPSRAQFEHEVAHGSMFVGAPATVAARIAAAMRTLDVTSFHLHYAVGAIPFQQRRTNIEMLGREVYPRVRELLASDGDASHTAHDAPHTAQTARAAQAPPSEHPDQLHAAAAAVKSPVRTTHAPLGEA
jgi:probable LLM family oxidoreductase